MDLDEEKLSMVNGLVEQCLLPEFQRDIGDEPLHRDDFNTFVYGMDKNLRLLFDILAKNESALLRPTEENEQFQTNLILLLNEQCGTHEAPFQSHDQSVIKHLQTLNHAHYKRIMNERRIYDKCLAFYKDRLTTSKWKRNIGSVYGYIQFCEVINI